MLAINVNGLSYAFALFIYLPLDTVAYFGYSVC